MKFYAVIGEHAREFRSVVAENRFYEQRGKPVIIEIDDRPSAEFRHEEHLCAQLAPMPSETRQTARPRYLI